MSSLMLNNYPKSFLTTAVLIIMTVFIVSCNIFTANEPPNIFYIDNATSWQPEFPGIKGGDIVYISSRDSNVLHIRGVHGTQSNPVVFKNNGETAYIKAVKFEDCSYIRFTGTGGDDEYGIHFLDSQWGSGIYVVGLSTNFEIDHCMISGIAGVGISIKQDFGGNPPSPYPIFSHLSIHDCRIDDISGAVGIYVGETKSPGMEFVHVRIYNNIITNTGRESIQIANCVQDSEIYGNFCYNAGTTELFAQGNNLQIGGNCGGVKVYNNVLVKGFEYGIISFANGGLEFYNNYIVENQGMYMIDKEMAPSLAPINIHNNYIYGFDSEGAGDNQHIDVAIDTCKIIIKNNQHSDNLYSKVSSADVEVSGNTVDLVNVNFDGSMDDLSMWSFILNP